MDGLFCGFSDPTYVNYLHERSLDAAVAAVIGVAKSIYSLNNMDYESTQSHSEHAQYCTQYAIDITSLVESLDGPRPSQ